MNYFLWVTIFIVSVVVTPAVRKFALERNFTDKADGDPLKIHKEPVALLGGLAVLVTMGVGLLIAVFGLQIAGWRLCGVVLGGLLVFAVGLRDDIKGVKPVIRLLAQLGAGAIILAAGIKIGFIPVPWVAVLLTLFYIAGAINAFNVIDGMDGLCAGISLISCAGFFVLGMSYGDALLSAMAAVLFLSLLGFLLYNFYPAKIFLGDAGSGLLGFMLGTMAVMATRESHNFIIFIVPVLIIAVPVLDMTFAVLRRMIRKKALFTGDRSHIYDLLLKKGLSQPVVWVILCGAQLVLVCAALMLHGG